MHEQVHRSVSPWFSPATAGRRVLGWTLLWMLGIGVWLGARGTVQAGEYSDWMTVHWDTIKNKTLRQLVIPGTHDSGAYDMISAWDFFDSEYYSIEPEFAGPDTAEKVAKYVDSGPFFEDWSQTQSRTV
ncbi:MAG: hypothetical protein IT581_10575 [Verrucomicrobiales bacterium]|nr:hypothetical protein [Verrucomicrobiales bacterium]